MQSVPLADDPQAWPGLPGGRGSSNVTGNNSSAETSENESEAAAGKLGKAGLTMADQISRARSGLPAGQKEEGKSRLTNLNGWSKAGGESSDVLEGRHKGRLRMIRASSVECEHLPLRGGFTPASFLSYIVCEHP